MAVNKEFIARWCEALESGEYEQTRGALHRLAPGDGGEPAGYCCVGVACRVAGLSSKKAGDFEWFNNERILAPDNLLILSGVPRGTYWELYNRNDGTNGSERQTFPEIAAYLRATYLDEGAA